MKSRRHNKHKHIGALLFLAPLLLLTSYVGYSLLQYAFQPKFGTLVVEGLLYSYGEQKGVNVQVAVTVDGRLYTAPTNISLVPGTYTVQFSAIRGYKTPPSKIIQVIAGKESYAIGIYKPIELVLNVTMNKIIFTNQTNVEVIHNVTPVVWVNVSNEPLQLGSYLFGNPVIAPHQNFTKVFESPGIYKFWILGNYSVSGQIKVS